MAQDATGTPTSLGIPKHNTAVDAPSGKGANAMMDAIDTLIAARISATLIDAKGDLLAGTASDAIARHAVGADGLFLKADSAQSTGLAWAAAGSTGYGTALPGSPADGDQFILVDSTSAPTWSWMLRYVSAKSSNKWVYIGGSDASAEVATSEGTSSTSYAALATAGPSIAVPVAGDYFVSIGSRITEQENDAATSAFMSYDIGGTGAVDADAIVFTINILTGASIPMLITAASNKKKAALTAVTLTAKYKTSALTATFANRWMHLTPIAIGG